MSATLHLATIGRDKTEQVIALLRQMAQARGGALPKIWVLLATRRQELSFRQRLIEADSGQRVYFNIEFFNFYSLNARLLKLAGEPVRRLDGLTRHNLLRQLLADMQAQGELTFFQRIATMRGFVSVVADLIDELKQSRVDVDAFAAAAHSEKDRELATIYRRYQERLRQSELADVEGEGWLALATLQTRPDIIAAVDLLLVDGYDQFTPVQAQLLAELSRSRTPVHITLTSLAGDDQSRLPQRSRLARERLLGAFAAAGVELKQRKVETAADNRHPDLQHLSAIIFRTPSGKPRGDAIKLIALPDPAEEVKAVLRAIKRLLLSGARADDMLIALRDWERYARYFESGRKDYNLPLLLQYENALHAAPVIAALIDLLGLAPRFRRRDLLDVLRSPYIDAGLSLEQIDLLDRISLEQQLLGGAEADWLEIIQLAQQRRGDARDDAGWTALSADQAEALAMRLSAFMRAVSAPDTAELTEYVRWLGGLLGADPQSDLEAVSNAYSLNIIMRAWAHDREYPAIVQRDINALNGLKRILRELLASDAILRATTRQDQPTEWPRFRSDLIHALQTQSDQRPGQSRQGQVLVTTASEARGLPHDHVFILGLAEGVFPAEASEDPLYLDSERERLQARGIGMETRAQRIDDRGLFYELISLPRRSLTLSRPTTQAGRVWIESHLWRAVNAVFDDLPLETRPVGAVIDPAESANGAELMLALADRLNQPDAWEGENALRARNWLLAQSNLAESWRRLAQRRRIELGRLSNAPFDHYSGVLSQMDLLEELARLLGEDRIWSASQLNDIGHCPFRFFAKRILGLSQTVEPELGADPLHLGALNHKILEETYRKVRSRQLDLHEDNLNVALEILADVADDILPRAPELLNFRETSTWTEESEIHLKRLEALIKLDFSPDSPLNLGETRSVFRQEEFVEEVRIRLGGGVKPPRVTALIDRIDSVDGNLIVVDYKTGSKPILRSDIEIGRDVQIVIYILALMSSFEEFGAEEDVAGGMFWHLRNLKTSGALATADEEDRRLLNKAKALIANSLAMARAGQFPVQAEVRENGKCSRYCEYSHLCRLHASGRYKTLPGLNKDA